MFDLFVEEKSFVDVRDECNNFRYKSTWKFCDENFMGTMLRTIPLLGLI